MTEHLPKTETAKPPCRNFFLFVGKALVAVILGVQGGGCFFRNNEAVSIVVTVFAIMSGFIITLIAVVGSSDTLLERATYLHALSYRRTVKGRLIRYSSLFVLYISTVLSVLLLVVFKDSIACNVRQFLYGVVFFLVIFAMLASLSLPFSLYKMYMERYDRKTRLIAEDEKSGKA